jgi:2-polyprenyl-3-methyl-5-hydroxy-6-metoxy-1,4-benzoquinol methylase
MMNFNEYASTWDTQKRLKRAEQIAYEISKELHKVVKDTKECIALEFGCGTGLVSFNLQSEFKKINLVDNSSEMIEVLKNKINHYQINNMVPYCLDLTREETIFEKIDIIFHSMVLHHIENVEEITRKFFNLIQKNGYMVIVDLNPEDGRFHYKYPNFNGHNGFEQDELKRTLEKVGFRNITSHTFYHDKKSIGEDVMEYSLFIMVGQK